MTRFIVIAMCLGLVGCEGSMIGPTSVGDEPNVAGTYSGILTLTITGADGHPPMRGTSTLVVTVTQSGSEVTLSATQTWPGESPILLWDGVRGTIDSLGIFTGSERKKLDGPGVWPRPVQEQPATVLRRHSQLQPGG